MLKKFLVHPDKGPSYGRWIVAGEEKDAVLTISQGPSWLVGCNFSQPKSLFIEYAGDLEPHELSREDHIRMCEGLGFKASEPTPFVQSSFGTVTLTSRGLPKEEKRSLTIADFVEKQLCEHGLFEDQAKGVVELLKNSPIMQETMRGRWNERADDYPKPLLMALMLHANTAAVTWIDENKPQHWARPMFTGELNTLTLK